jgi:anti-sigma B factor antagonist
MTTVPAGLKISNANGVHVVQFTEASILDPLRVEKLRSDLEKMVAANAAPNIVLSFQGVTHISSAVLGVVMGLNKQCEAKGGGVILTNIGGHIVQAFTITRIDKILKIFPNTESAQAEFERRIKAKAAKEKKK